MPKLSRFIIIGALLLLEIVLFREAIKIRDSENPDNSKLIMLFVGILFGAIVIGVMVAMVVIPAIGEGIGNFFFNPNQEIEKNAHSDALAKIAQGDYLGAIEEYQKNLVENPDDTHAMSEIIHIYCDKLHDHDAAEHFLEDALQQEWPPEQGAFIASRLVDVYWNYRRDAARARHVLQQIAETMPNTRHAANAVHRLHEIDRALADESAGIVHYPLPSGQPEPKGRPGDMEAES